MKGEKMNTIGAYNYNAPAMRANDYQNTANYDAAATYPQAYDSYNAYDTYESYQEPAAKKKGGLATLLLGALAIGATVFAVIKHRAASKATENARKEFAEQIKNLQDDVSAKASKIEQFENETRKEARQRIRARNKAKRAEEGGPLKRLWNKITGKNKPDDAKEIADDAKKAAEDAAKD